MGGLILARRLGLLRESESAEKLLHPRGQARAAHRVPKKKGQKVDRPQNDISIVINLNDPSPIAHSEKSTSYETHSLASRIPEML